MNKKIVAVLGGALLLSSASSWAGPSTRDWIPAPVGTNIIAGYAGMEKSTRMYSEGKRIQGAPKIDVQYGIYRQMHYRELFGKTVQYEIIVPMSRATMKGGGMPKDRLTGIGDVNLGAAIWLYNNDETRTYVAWEPLLCCLPVAIKDHRQMCLQEQTVGAPFRTLPL